MGAIRTSCRRLDGLSWPPVYEPVSEHRDHAPHDFAAWLRERRDALRGELLHGGAILFRGFAVDNAEQFECIARVFTPQLSSYRGGDSPRMAVTGSGVYTSTVYPASLPISLHNEMSYTNRHPALLFFYCEIQPESGGETPLADCRELYRRLDSRTVRRFQERGIRYVQNLPDGATGFGKSWQQTFETEDRAEVEALLRARGAGFEWRAGGALQTWEIVSPVRAHPVSGELLFFSQAHQWHVSALDPQVRRTLLSRLSERDLYHHCTFGDGTPVPEADLEEIRGVLDAIAIRFPWQARDLLVVDNLLVAHGRSPFRGPRRILVAMGGDTGT